MNTFKKIFTFVLLTSLLSKSVHASDQFVTSYDITYDISKTGVSDITQRISIKNKQDDLVATSYKLNIKEIDIYDISGKDPKGELDVNSSVNGSATEISTNFNEQVVGKNRTLNWELSYKSNDIARKTGNIWNIHIPKIASLESIGQYNVTLTIPKSFGPKIFITPNPVDQKETSDKYIFSFNKESIENNGVTASFGTYQTLNFEISYTLKNESSLNSYQEIALPPEIPEKQQISFNSIVPFPNDIYEDGDGNLLAKYKLKPNEILKIRLTGSTRLSGKQINPRFGGSFDNLPKDLVKKYTKKNNYWEVDSEEIKAIVKNIYKPNQNVSENAQNAYNFVVENLTYDFDISEESFVNRNGALKTITSEGPWTCMEFTDLFVTLARSMGIPTREINGYAIAKNENNALKPISINLNNGEYLHSWAEYYDPKLGWVQVDPTWGNTSKSDYFTKLDTNHFAFVRKGLDSEYPYPAGAYRFSDDDNQLQIDVADDIDEKYFEPRLSFERLINLSLKNKIRYKIKNNTGIYLYKINNTNAKILPYQTKIILLDKDDDKLTYKTFNGIKNSVEIPNGSNNLTKIQKIKMGFLNAVLGLVLCTILYFSIARPKFLRKQYLLLRNRLQGPNQ